MAFTLATAKIFLRDYNRQATSQQDDRVITRICNDANRNFHAYGEWDFDKRRLQFSLQAPYSTGTVSVTNGSATLTGSGTTFTSAMQSRVLRVAGGANEYLLTTYNSATSFTFTPTYLQTDASAQNYQIVDERYPLPAYFRTMAQVQIDNIQTPLMSDTFENNMYNRKFFKEVSYPRAYAIEWLPTSTLTTPAAYLWIYPAPSQLYVVDAFYYIWPSEMASDNDVFQVPYAAEGALRQFLLAELFRYQRDPNTSQQIGNARREADISLAAFRARKEMNFKRDWNPLENAGDMRNPYIDFFAPGQPSNL